MIRTASNPIRLIENNASLPGLRMLPGRFIRSFNIVFFLLVLLWLFPATSGAVPHLLRQKPEPPVKPGMPFSRRLAKILAPSKALLAPQTYPYSTKILFLKVDFPPDSDSATTGSGEWNDSVYAKDGDPDYWLNIDEAQFKNYYNEVSYGLLSIDVVRSALYRMPKSMRNYGNETQPAVESFIYDAITTAMTSTAAPISQTELSTYDAVLIVHAGAGEEADAQSNTSYDIWSLYYYNPDGIPRNGVPEYDSTDKCTNCLEYTLKDGNPVSEVILMPQTDSQDGVVVDPLGVYVHEFGHWLGLPDLYCTALMCALDGVGEWSLMGDGMYNRANSTDAYGSSPAHLDAWSKMFLGWVTPTDPQTNPETSGMLIMNPVEMNQTIYKMQASSSNPSRYYLLENRQQALFDAGIPGHGLLVWQVDEDVINSRFASNTINNSATGPGVKLIEADGDNALMQYGCSEDHGIDCGSEGDSFPGRVGNTRFAPLTNPSSDTGNSIGWVNLSNIAEAAQTITFKAGYAPSPPSITTVFNSGHMTWTPADENDPAVAFNVYKNSTTTPVVSAMTQTSYSDPDTWTGDVYFVTSLDASGNESSFSGVMPIITSSPGSLSFSAINSPKNVTIMNDASANAMLIITSIATSGTNASDFSVSSESCTAAGLQPGASCTISVIFNPAAAGTKNANLDIFSNDPVTPTLRASLFGSISSLTGGSSSRDSGCFIATAAYGSYLDPHVKVLRDFRDGHLMTNRPGRTLVEFYYRYSPPMAEFISHHDSLRLATRMALTPVVLAVEHPVLMSGSMILAVLAIIGIKRGYRMGRVQ